MTGRPRVPVRCLGLLLLAGAGLATAAGAPRYLGLAVHDFRVVTSYPHDPTAFTQGLVFDDGRLYESTGLYGRSRLLVRALDDPRPLAVHDLPPDVFGEGLALVGERLVQLTWRAQTGFVYDRNDLRLLRRFAYRGEGWGLTFDGRRLIKSNGSSRLEFLDPDSLAVVGACEVLAGATPVRRLNELEMVQGALYANIWQDDRIARIDPDSCRVRDWIDLGRLARPFKGRADVLNGIAFDASAGRLLVTGKLWPRLFEIEVLER